MMCFESILERCGRYFYSLSILPAHAECINWKNFILLLLCCWLRQGLGGVILKIYFLKYIFLRCIFELIHSFEKEKKKWYVFLNINAFLISSKINQMPKFCKKSFSKATSIEKGHKSNSSQNRNCRVQKTFFLQTNLAEAAPLVKRSILSWKEIESGFSLLNQDFLKWHFHSSLFSENLFQVPRWMFFLLLQASRLHQNLGLMLLL